MIYINENNKNEMITMEEAEEILKMAKRLYPGPLSGVELDWDESFALLRQPNGERYVLIPDTDDEYFNQEEFDRISTNILEHVNKTYGYNFANNTKTKCLHAICHEIGHAIDFYQQEFRGNYYYEDSVQEEYNDFYDSTSAYHRAVEDLNDYLAQEEFEIDEDVVKEMRAEIDEIESELDYEYRMITSEAAADKFSAYFMTTHLRYLKFMFED